MGKKSGFPWKSVLLLIAVIAMIFGSCPEQDNGNDNEGEEFTEPEDEAPVFPIEEPILGSDEYGYFYFDYTESSVFITGYFGDGGEVEIPPIIDEKPITVIWDEAFKSCKLTDIIIPETVTAIGYSAFEDNDLTSVIIPDSVVSIEYNAFFGNRLTDVAIGNSVASIGYGAFSRNCLIEITLPDSLIYIGHDAFHENYLTKVTIGADVQMYDSAIYPSLPGNFVRAYNRERKKDKADGKERPGSGTYARTYASNLSSWSREQE